jgi:hypothetical protein
VYLARHRRRLSGSYARPFLVDVHDSRDHLERVIGRPREFVVGDDGHLAGDHGAAPRPSIDDIPGVGVNVPGFVDCSPVFLDGVVEAELPQRGSR